jgi:hypothetical protein
MLYHVAIDLAASGLFGAASIPAVKWPPNLGPVD